MTDEIKEAAEKPAKKTPVVAVDVNDIDASWDGTGSLDEHRTKALRTMKQPGFGSSGKVASDGK